MAGSPWINPTTFANPRPFLSAFLAPLAVVGAVVAVASGLWLSDISMPEGTPDIGIATILSAGFLMAYSIGLLGALLICVPAFILLRRYGRQVGLIYVALGFVGGAIVNPQVLVAAVYSISDHPWSPDLIGEALATVPLYGPLGAIVGASFFWLLVRTDSKTA